MSTIPYEMVNQLTDLLTSLRRATAAMFDGLRASFLALNLAVVAIGGAGAAEVIVRGDDSGKIVTLLEQTLTPSSDTVGDPRSVEFVNRVRLERDRLTDVLRGLGYYAADIEVRVGDAPLALAPGSPGGDVGLPGPVTFVATLGPVYRIKSYRVVSADEADDPAAGEQLSDILGLPATAENLATVEADWRSVMQQVGHALAGGVKRSVSQDDTTREVDVVLQVALGPLVRFGSVHFLGLLHLDPVKLRALVGFQPGERYQAEKLLGLRTVLESQPLVESARVHLSSGTDESGFHPVTVTIVEKPVKGPAGPLDGLIGISVLGAAAMSVAAVQVARARTGDSTPWRRHWYFYLVAILLLGSAVMVTLRVVKFLG